MGHRGAEQIARAGTARGVAAIPLNPGIINTDMLRSTFGGEALHYPSAETWAETF